jgi:hypothetical protein
LKREKQNRCAAALSASGMYCKYFYGRNYFRTLVS